MLERRTFFTAVLVVALATAGCVSGPGQQATDGTADETPAGTDSTTVPPTDTDVPRQSGEVEWPDGPKERPDRPDEWSESAAREFVKTHEYRYAYNSLWYGDASDVNLECEVHSSSPAGDGYEVVVSCTGYSNTQTVVDDGGTPVEMHADWFTQTFRYYVDDDSIVRDRTDG
jgi:hypothetical protein